MPYVVLGAMCYICCTLLHKLRHHCQHEILCFTQVCYIYLKLASVYREWLNLWWTVICNVYPRVEQNIVSYYRGSPGRGSSGQGGAGACWVHGAIFRNIQGSIQIFDVHQRIQVLCLRRWQDVGLDTVNLTQLEVRRWDGMIFIERWSAGKIQAHFALSRHCVCKYWLPADAHHWRVYFKRTFLRRVAKQVMLNMTSPAF